MAVRRHLENVRTMPELVLCSSAVRTVETLDGVRECPAAETAIEIEPELYGADVAELLERLRRVPEAVRGVMLIGHNPGVEDLALLLTGAGDAAARAAMASKFPTAAMAHLRIDDEWSKLRQGAAHLAEFWTPR